MAISFLSSHFSKLDLHELAHDQTAPNLELLAGDQDRMNLSKIDRGVTVNPTKDKLHSTPALKCLTPEAAKEMLLRHSDINDPEVKFMLECIERLQDSKGS